MSGADRLDRRDPVIASLRRLKGLLWLRVTLRDDTARRVDVPKAGNRWEKISKVLDALDWVRIEACGKDEGVLGVIEPEIDEDDIEEDYESTRVSEFRAVAKVCHEIQRDTMKETRAMFQTQLDGMARLMDAVVNGVQTVQDSYKIAMQVQAANAASGGDDEMGNMMKMALALTAMPRPVPAPPKNANPTTKEHPDG